MANDPDLLSTLYNKQKQRTLPPSSIKRHVIHRAKRLRSRPATNWRQWAVAYAATVVLAVLIVVWNTDQLIQQPLMARHDFLNIELHGYRDAQPEVAVATTQEQHVAYFNDYQQHQLIVHNRYQLPATVVDADGGLALQSCRNRIIQLSSDLVINLRNEQRLSDALQKGDIVEIAFNQDGYILNIHKTSELPSC